MTRSKRVPKIEGSISLQSKALASIRMGNSVPIRSRGGGVVEEVPVEMRDRSP